ncbi:MAG: hypothetical protein NWQ31_08585, partial [Polaribacter sp.]|nr:hypothetical protein [Polaribacter sp.]
MIKNYMLLIEIFAKRLVSKYFKDKLSFILLLSFFINIPNNFSQEKVYKKLLQKYSDKAWEAITEKKDSGIYYSNKIIEISKANNDTFNEMLGYEYRGIYLSLIHISQ